MDSPIEIEQHLIDNNKKKTIKKKVFNDTWLENELFKDWLRRSPNINKALCSFCGIEIACKKSTLVTHAKSKSHIKKMPIVKATLPSASNDENKVIDKKEAKKNIIKMDIKFATFAAKHNIPLSVAEDFVQFFNQICVMDGIPENFVYDQNEDSSNL